MSFQVQILTQPAPHRCGIHLIIILLGFATCDKCRRKKRKQDETNWLVEAAEGEGEGEAYDPAKKPPEEKPAPKLSKAKAAKRERERDQDFLVGSGNDES